METPDPTPAPEIRPAPKPFLTDRNLAVLCHLAGLALFTSIPFGNVLGPLIVWLLAREDRPGVKEAVNFQITMLLAMIVSTISLLMLIGFVLLPLVILFDFIMILVAAVRVSQDGKYRYPLCIRFLS